MLKHRFDELSPAILCTLLYSDVFDFPLTACEIHRFLYRRAATYEEVLQALHDEPRITKQGDYYTLPGREGIVRVRQERERQSQELMPYALRYGRWIGSLPFIRMVALTGSLAVMNVSTNADLDYLLVTAPGRLWTARAFTLLFGRWTRAFGHTICPNIIIAENSLAWRRHDLYSARELCQMIPTTGKDVYAKLMRANSWVQQFLPNARTTSVIADRLKISTYFEVPLSGKLGDRFERWEIKRKIARFSRQAGFGEETIFNAEMCQGNFDHHKRWTEVAFQERLHAYMLEDISLDENIAAPPIELCSTTVKEVS